MVRKSSWVRFYLRRHVQAVEGDKTVSLLVNAKTGNSPAEHHTPARHLPGEGVPPCSPSWARARGPGGGGKTPTCT